MKLQLQIPPPHVGHAELRPGVKNPEWIFRKTSYRFSSGCITPRSPPSTTFVLTFATFLRTLKAEQVTTSIVPCFPVVHANYSRSGKRRGVIRREPVGRIAGLKKGESGRSGFGFRASSGCFEDTIRNLLFDCIGKSAGPRSGVSGILEPSSYRITGSSPTYVFPILLDRNHWCHRVRPLISAPQT